MKKLADFKNGDAIDLLADILEPAVELMTDKEVVGLVSKPETRVKGISKALKAHKSAIIEIMAKLEGVDVEKYEFTVFDLPVMVLEILNDETLVSFFAAQSQQNLGVSFGSVTESTGETDEI